MTEMTATIIVGLLIPLLGTMLGSAFVFFMKDEMSARLQKSLLGFASGVMVAASVWSLLIPAMEMKADSGAWSVVPAAVGFLMGIGFLLLIDELTPHLHIGTDKPEGVKSQPARRYGCRRSVCRSRKPSFKHLLSRSNFRIVRYSHTEHPRRCHHLHANACGRQQPMEILRVRFSQWSRRANRSHRRSPARLISYAGTPLHARLCGRRHVLRSSGRAHTRSLKRSAQ